MAPSNKHLDLSRRALVWLSSQSTKRGIRGACEVQLAKQYVADAAALGSFQWRFFEQYCRIAGVPTQETMCYWLSIFEVKVSRADFFATFRDHTGNRHLPSGNLHWCVTPAGLIDSSELPDFWGHLISAGGGLREVKAPRLCSVSEQTLDGAAHVLIWKSADLLVR